MNGVESLVFRVESDSLRSGEQKLRVDLTLLK